MPRKRERLQAFWEGVQGLARFAGCQLCVIGWFSFGLSVVDICSGFTQAEPFRFAGYFLVPGWLLLRLGAGLFPFCRWRTG